MLNAHCCCFWFWNGDPPLPLPSTLLLLQRTGRVALLVWGFGFKWVVESIASGDLVPFRGSRHVP